MANVTKVTPEKKAEAIELRRQGYNMTAVSRATDISRMEWWRTRKDDPDFAALWDDASEHKIDDLEDSMIQRAYNGTPKVTRTYDRATGQLIREDETIEYDTTLQIFVMKHRRPDVYNPSVKVETTSKTEVSGTITHELSAPAHVLATWEATLQYDPRYKAMAPTLLPGVQAALAALPEAEAHEITDTGE